MVLVRVPLIPADSANSSLMGPIGGVLTGPNSPGARIAGATPPTTDPERSGINPNIGRIGTNWSPTMDPRETGGKMINGAYITQSGNLVDPKTGRYIGKASVGTKVRVPVQPTVDAPPHQQTKQNIAPSSWTEGRPVPPR